MGFVSWAFLTDAEYISNEYCGLEVFARDYGDCLVVIDMIAKGVFLMYCLYQGMFGIFSIESFRRLFGYVRTADRG